MSRRRLWWPLVAAMALAGTALVTHQRQGRAVVGTTQANCFGDLNATPYSGGFQTSNFSSLTAANINSGGAPLGGVQLNTALAPLDPNHIVLPFDQDVLVQSVYNNAGATHTMGWFYLDQIEPTYYNPVSNVLVDANGNGVPDLYEKIFQQQGGTPKLLSSGLSYSDGGNYPHIPNLLEPAPIGVGNLIFQIMNDNTRTGWTATYNGVNMPPIQDQDSNIDGIFDYDVNGDGTVANEPDRTVDLGIIQGNREVVFFLEVYYGQTGKNATFGMTGSGTQNSGVVVHFSKAVLNTDVGGVGANDTISYVDIGAPGVKSTGNYCERATPATTAGGVPTPNVGSWVACSGTPYPSRVNNNATLQNTVNGWLSQGALDRLNTPTYGNFVMPHEVHRVVAGPSGTAPHTFVGAPSTDPNRWIIGFEDLLGYTGTSCASCTHSDFSLEDVVVLLQRVNGGEVVSNLISGDIPAAHLSDTTISKIRVRYSASYPSPGCDGVSASINIYYSVDNKVTWTQVPFASLTSGDFTVDVLGAGQTGNQLFWKADFVSPSQYCQPVLNDLAIGYESVEHGEFRFAAPIPLSNIVYAGSLETPPFLSPDPAPTDNDFAPRGHFYSNKLYDPSNPSVTLVSSTDPTVARLWDAGAQLSAPSFSPSLRALYTVVSGAATAFTIANNTALYPLLLPTGVRTTLSSGKYVYDFTGDGTVSSADSQFLIEWTRGWEIPSTVTMTPAQSPLMRAWRLAAVHNSAPGITGPPPREAWLDGSAAPSAMVTASNTYRAANATRRTLALVGAQDGMLHAFDAGQLRYGADPACTVVLQRGCYAGTTDAQRYGSGQELWAWIPPSQLSQLKNNHEQTRGYLPAANPTAEIDGSVNVEDIYVAGSPGTFKTIAYASLGRRQPYVTAVDITNPTTPNVAWPSDFSDPDYNGSELGPSVGLTSLSGGRWLTTFSSGLSSAAGAEFLFVLDALTGVVVSKVQLNTGVDSGQANGFAGYVSMINAKQDGLADRAYVVDTNGRIFKYNFASGTHCVVASTGESVYAGMAFQVTGNAAAPVVEMFLGGAPNPDGSGAVAPGYHLFAFKDNDPLGACTEGGAQLVYAVPLTGGRKLWAAPFIGSDGATVQYATAATTSASVCATGSGALYSLSVNGDGAGNPVGGVPSSPPPLSGSPVSSVFAFDGHVLANTINSGSGGGNLAVLNPSGAGNWNTVAGASGSTGGTQSYLQTLFWQEL